MDSWPDKRIVLIHTQGAHAGLHRILGTEAELREARKVDRLPEFVESVDFLDHEGSCSLLRVTPRAVYYREVMVPVGLGTFDKAQQ